VLLFLILLKLAAIHCQCWFQLFKILSFLAVIRTICGQLLTPEENVISENSSDCETHNLAGMTTTNGHIEFSTNSRSEEQLQEFLQGNDTNNSGGETYANGIGVQHTSVSNTVEKAAKMLEVLMENRQKIFMKGNSVDVTHGVHASDVIVHQAPATQTKGSSKVKIRNIVDYGWEHKYYCGNVVAVHMSGNFMAYAIKITGKNESYVRIVNRKTSQRELLKGMSGQVKDIAFAYSLTQILLAVIDEPGTLFVYEITEPTDNSIRCTMMLQVSRAKEDKMCEYRRVTWCRYHPEDQQTDDACDDGSIPSSTDDYSKLLVMTHDNIAEMIDVDVVAKEYGKEVMSCTLEDGFGTIIVHTKPITEAVFSPDGSALATASLDGYITFYQVYLQDKTTKPRCLHTWKPFDGQPVTSLFFLDNHRDLKPDQSYWKFAVTGTDNNRQLKVWCCVDWSCLQTISFQSSDNESCIKACLDLSAEYLLLSDIKHRVLYILQLYQEPELSKACIVNLSEFPLICPMLSFTVSYVGLRRAKKSIDQSDNIDIAKSDSECDEDVDEDNDDVTVSNSSSNNANTQDQETVIKLCYVQPKSLQQCSIIFPSSGHLSQKSGGTTTLHGTSQDSINTTMSYKDALSDLSIDNTTTTTHDTSGSNVHDEDGNNASIIVQPASLSMQSTESKTKELLLTPEAFKSSPNVSSGTKNSGKSEQHVLTSVTSDDEVKIGPLVDIECISKFPVSDRRSSAEVNGNVIPPMRRSQHSDSSSPSREVAEILSPNTNESNNHKRSISREEKDEEETMDQNETCSNTSIGSGHYNHSGVGWPAAPDI
ncbi:EDC4 (predicted), partial [Pycnogonum litorale]